MKGPVIHKTVEELSTHVTAGHKGNYDVQVGALKEEDLPIYLVVNRDTGVVEFFNENLFFIKDWLNHFVLPQPEGDKDAEFENIVKMAGRKN